VREAPEAGDDVAVQARKMQVLRRGVAGLRQGDAPFLILKRFGVHEGHVEKRPPRGRLNEIKTSGDGGTGDVAGPCVVGEGTGVPAMKIAGELVEEKDKSERGRRRGGPGAKPAGGRCVVGGAEAVGDLGVEGGIAPEPTGGPRLLEPEMQDLRREAAGGRAGGVREADAD